MTDTVTITVRVSHPLAESVKAAAKADGLNQSDFLRIALEKLLAARSGNSEPERRRQFSAEYQFLALDLMMQREYPDVHNELLVEAERRMEALLGAA